MNEILHDQTYQLMRFTLPLNLLTMIVLMIIMMIICIK